jgi:hypothetical protein
MMTDDAAWHIAQHVCRTGYADLPASADESALRDLRYVERRTYGQVGKFNHKISFASSSSALPLGHGPRKRGRRMPGARRHLSHRQGDRRSDLRARSFA